MLRRPTRTSRPGCRRVAGGTGWSPSPVGSRVDSAKTAAHFDRNGDQPRDAEGEQQCVRRLVAECPSAEVAEQDGVGGPEQRGDRYVRQEPAQPREADEARGERRCGAAARNEPSHDEDVAPSVAQKTLGPIDPLPRFLAVEEPFLE